MSLLVAACGFPGSLEGLMLKLQYFGHLMQKANSLEKTLMRPEARAEVARGGRWASRRCEVPQPSSPGLLLFHSRRASGFGEREQGSSRDLPFLVCVPGTLLTAILRGCGHA